MPSKARELLEEFRTVAGNAGLLDVAVPPVLFMLLNGWEGFRAAILGALGAALLITLLRISRRQPLTNALAGLASVALAIALAYWLGRSEGYFLPDLVNNALLAVLAFVSLILRKPMVAWTSHLARRWPLSWYWHRRVRPAYTEVTIAWTAFFALRLLWQVSLFRRGDVARLTLVDTVMGWPAIVALLVVSYLYGTWRLATLRGPSVEEFRSGAPPPWQGQRRGF